MLKPDRRAYRDLPVYSFSDWDSVSTVKGALAQLEIGQLELAAILCEAMLRDDRIGAVLSTRFDGLAGLDLEMKAPEGEEGNQAALDVVSEAQEVWTGIAPESTVSQLLFWGRMLGIGVAEKIFDDPDAPFTPRLKVWHPRFMYFRWDTRTFWVNTEDGPVELKQGDPHWVIYAPYGYYRGWMRGLVRALAVPWLIRQWAFRDWARYSEVHGIPIRAGIVPAQAADSDKDEFISALATIGSESTIRLPQGGDGNNFDLRLIEAVGNTWEGFDKLLGRCDTAIAVRVLGQNLTTEVSGGAYAAAQVHERVQADVLKGDAEGLATCLHDQVLVEWTQLNHGNADLAPWPHWPVDPPDDLGKAALALKAFGDGLSAVRLAGVPADVAELCERFSVPLLEGAEILPPTPPTPPAPPPGKKGDAGNADEGDEVDGGEGDAGGEGDGEKKTQLHQLAHRTAPRPQQYVDELAANARDAAARALAPDLRVLQAAVREATNYDDLKRRLVQAYAGMDPSRFARLTEKALLLARLAGNHAVLEEA